ncbi:hypothetical protein [Erwinia sp. 9145]|uniref:hypothetical protein n=1 Tax=Erwinia sp. 9145 TaxID=1500895 RepID=UPI000553C4F9|nr:hypothetical protein [Erwinia sp. 9145]
MSVELLNPTPIHLPQQFGGGFDSNSLNTPQGGGADHQGLSGGAINFASPQAGMLNYGNPGGVNSLSAQDGLAGSGQGVDDNLRQLVSDLVNQIMKAFAQMMQQGGNDDATSPAGKDAGDSSAQPQTASFDSMSDPSQTEEQPATPANATAQPQPQTATPSAETDATNQSASKANVFDKGTVAGSGPRTFDITNKEDHDINIGQFDKDNKLVAEMTLKPGESGKMKYQNDFTGVLKQSDSEGKYQDSASRLEFYNGFVNTSDIDGRNAAIHAEDGKGFEIGDEKSIADEAPDSIVSKDSAGNKTIAGWYDGSTDTMKKGGEYMTNKLGTGDTYMHPDDDKLPNGQNPMRHTDSMELDVTFGKA